MEHFVDFKKNVVRLYATTWKELRDLFTVKFKKQTTEIHYTYTYTHTQILFIQVENKQIQPFPKVLFFSPLDSVCLSLKAGKCLERYTRVSSGYLQVKEVSGI